MSEDPIRFEAGDVNLQRYAGNGTVNRIDPSGLHEIEWIDSWTPKQQERVLAALEQVRARLQSLIEEINNLKKKLESEPCVLKELRPDLDRLQMLFSQMLKDLKSTSRNLEISHFDFKNPDVVARAWPTTPYSFFDYRIQFNDSTKGKNWEAIALAELAAKVFHELSHHHNTPRR